MISMAHETAKLLAARRALSFIEDGMAVGLGTGSTATLFIKELGERVRSGLNVRCIASSKASHELARSLGIPLKDFNECPYLDVAVDGADEVAPGLALIKGGGGALLREKIVASAAKKFVVVADQSKVVDHLGGFPVPVEVIQMACPLVTRHLSDLGFEIIQRRTQAGEFYITDEGNYILDCKTGPIIDPSELAAKIRAMVGVVEHGLFLSMATVALIADEDQLVERTS